jgi:septin family protein
MASHDDLGDSASQVGSQASRHPEIALPENARLVLQMAPPSDDGGRGPGGGNGSGPSFDSGVIDGHSNPSSYVRDVRSAFSGVPKIKPQWLDRYMKILVVGESGMGKTTFIQNLFAAYAQDPNLKVASVAGPTSKQVFASNPQQLCTTIDVTDEANQIRYHYSVQDTPGWEAIHDNMEPINAHIHECNLKCLENEQDARRLGPMHKAPDPRVDVALYFVNPHRIKEMDVKFMAHLSEAVPVIPILAKADCMTSSELASFRKTVRETLEQANRDYGRDVMFRFSEEALGEAHPVHQVPPFAIVSSRQMDSSVGRYWPVRQYPWGTCEALSSDHSDVASLKKLLLEVCFEEFKTLTEERYYAFREEELLNLNDDDRGRKVRSRFIINRERHQPIPIKALRWVAGVIVTYGLAAAILGGRNRLQEDVAVAKEKASSLGATIAEAAKDSKSYIEEKVNPPPPPRKKFLGLF